MTEQKKFIAPMRVAKTNIVPDPKTGLVDDSTFLVVGDVTSRTYEKKSRDSNVSKQQTPITDKQVLYANRTVRMVDPHTIFYMKDKSIAVNIKKVTVLEQIKQGSLFSFEYEPQIDNLSGTHKENITSANTAPELCAVLSEIYTAKHPDRDIHGNRNAYQDTYFVADDGTVHACADLWTSSVLKGQDVIDTRHLMPILLNDENSNHNEDEQTYVSGHAETKKRSAESEHDEAPKQKKSKHDKNDEEEGKPTKSAFQEKEEEDGGETEQGTKEKPITVPLNTDAVDNAIEKTGQHGLEGKTYFTQIKHRNSNRTRENDPQYQNFINDLLMGVDRKTIRSKYSFVIMSKRESRNCYKNAHVNQDTGHVTIDYAEYHHDKFEVVEVSMNAKGLPSITIADLRSNGKHQSYPTVHLENYPYLLEQAIKKTKEAGPIKKQDNVPEKSESEDVYSDEETDEDYDEDYSY